MTVTQAASAALVEGALPSSAESMWKKKPESMGRKLEAGISAMHLSMSVLSGCGGAALCCGCVVDMPLSEGDLFYRLERGRPLYAG